MISLEALIEVLRGVRRYDVATTLVQDCEPDGTGYRVYELYIATSDYAYDPLNLQISIEELQ